jgi:hypothetical protein
VDYISCKYIYINSRTTLKKAKRSKISMLRKVRKGNFMKCQKWQKTTAEKKWEQRARAMKRNSNKHGR